MSLLFAEAGQVTNLLMQGKLRFTVHRSVQLRSACPCHRYIGDGLLACAVLGNVFASPSVDAVYRAIAACASPHGVLVIVKNYTGDRLNFGMVLINNCIPYYER